jgi:excisionase family DNA binding protein
MTTAQAGERLGVSQRQVQRLVRVGEVPARRTAGDAWVLDALSVNALARSRPSRGRPWSSDVAWGALWMLSELEAGWLDNRTRSRLAIRLKAMDPDEVVHACRRRADVRRCRVSESFRDEFRGELVSSGADAAERFGLAGDPSRVEGYCGAEAWERIRSRFRLVDDTYGNVVVRVATFATPIVGRETMPDAVVAVDLAESFESRERAAGLRELGRLLGE